MAVKRRSFLFERSQFEFSCQVKMNSKGKEVAVCHIFSHGVSHSPRPVCVASLCRVVSRGAHPHGPSWLPLPPGSRAAPAALHRTAGERGPSPGTTAHTKTHRVTMELWLDPESSFCLYLSVTHWSQYWVFEADTISSFLGV